eukprot:2950509-Prymnesium_polylepis.1
MVAGTAYVVFGRSSVGGGERLVARSGAGVWRPAQQAEMQCEDPWEGYADGEPRLERDERAAAE